MTRTACAVLVLALVLGGCNSAGIILPGLAQTFRDPVGDATGAAGTIYDVTTITVTKDSTQARVEVDFVQPVVLPPAGGTATPAEFAGYLDFDTDQNRATGLASCSAAIGADRYVDMATGRNLDGTYNVRTSGGSVVGTASMSASGNRLTATVTKVVLAEGDMTFNLALAAGNGAIPTDCAPDAAVITVTQWQRR